MPLKGKMDYLGMSFDAGENKTKTIIGDANSMKGIDQKVKCIKYLANGQVEICVTRLGMEYVGTGTDKAEAAADACGKFLLP